MKASEAPTKAQAVKHPRYFSKQWRNKSPVTQIMVLGLVCFCCPGMFNAINGLGAVGKSDATTTDNANTALAVTFAVFTLVAGGLFNIVGHRALLFLGGALAGQVDAHKVSFMTELIINWALLTYLCLNVSRLLFAAHHAVKDSNEQIGDDDSFRKSNSPGITDDKSQSPGPPPDSEAVGIQDR